MQSCPVIVKYRMGMAQWGLWPDYAQNEDRELAAKLKNARSETIFEKPTFAGLWRKGRRCLVPADGFYEWPEIKEKGQPPFKITSPDQACIAFAGLWTRHGDQISFTILTQAAQGEIAKIHSRMPVAFRPDQAQEWFEKAPDDALTMIRDMSIAQSWHAESIEAIPALKSKRPDTMPGLFEAV